MATIRPAGPADFPKLHRVRMSVRENRLSDQGSIDAADYQAMLEAGGRAWAAEVDGRIVGFAVADLATGRIWALFIEPCHEGKGIGRRLHDEMVGWLFHEGVDPIRLGTDPGTRAETFYRAAGWRPVGLAENGEVRMELRRTDWRPGRPAPPAPDLTRGLPSLHGDGVRLRQLTPADVGALLVIFSDPEVTRFTTIETLRDRADAERFLGDIERGIATGDFYQWGVERKDAPGVIGTCTLFAVEPRHRRAEVGFILGRDHWGQGLGTDAARTLVRFAFDELGLHRLEADADPRNTASRRILARLGFREEGRLRERYVAAGEVQDAVVYGLLRTDPRS